MENLRPMERRMIAMRDDGIPNDEIAKRFGRSASHIERILQWTAIPRSGPQRQRSPRAIERRVLTLRAAGETHAEIGARFRRSAPFIQQVEGLAHYRLGLNLLSSKYTGQSERGITR